jgi:hypothetical protein
VRAKTDAALAALAALEKQDAALKEALTFAIHVAKTGDARLALEKRAQAAREAAERAAREAAELGALLAE